MCTDIIVVVTCLEIDTSYMALGDDYGNACIFPLYHWMWLYPFISGSLCHL